MSRSQRSNKGQISDGITVRGSRGLLLGCSAIGLFLGCNMSPSRAEPFSMRADDTALAEKTGVAQAGSATPSSQGTSPFAMFASDISTTAAGDTIYDGTSSAGSASLETSGEDAVIFQDSATASSASIINNGGQTRFEDDSTAASASLTANDTGIIRFADRSTAADARITTNAGGSLQFEGAASAGSAFITANGNVAFSGQSSADNAQLTINEAGSLRFGDQSDGGIARIANSGTTTFEGSSSLAGGQITNNETGSVRFLDNSSAGTTAFIANSGTVGFEGNSTLGDAALTNNDTGTVSFAGRSTAGSGFISNSGAVAFSENSSAGSAELIGNQGGSLRFEGSSTAAQSTISGAADIAFVENSTAGSSTIGMSPGSTIIFADEAEGGTASLQLDKGALLDISASDGLVGLGSLSGAGTAQLGAATLSVGDATPLVNFDGTITDNGAGGGLVKRGSGILNLSGTSDYSGETRVQSGTLEAGRDNAFSAASAFTVATGGTLALGDFDQEIGSLAGGGTVDLVDARLTSGGNNQSTSFSGAIGGTGGLTKLGTGTLTLSGINDYTGDTLVAAGGLSVDGSIAGSAVTVGELATLSGTGTIGSASVAGRLLAQTRGALTVLQDLTLDPTATFLLELDGARAGLVNVGGDVFVNGALDLVSQGIGAAGNYEFLVSGGTISGSFDTVTGDFAFLDPSVIYGGSTLTLRLERNDVTFASIGDTRNQRAAAAGIESLGADNDLYDAILPLNREQALAGFDLASGEAHAQVFASLQSLQQTSRRTVLNHLALRRDTGLWGQGGYLQDDLTDDNNAAGARLSGGWGTGGFDAELSRNLRVGLAASYAQTDFTNEARRSFGDIETIGLSVYGDWQRGRWRLSGGGDLARHSVDLERNIQAGLFSARTQSDYSAWSGGAFAELGYDLSINDFRIEPFIGLSWTRTQREGFAETGGGAVNLSANRHSADQTDAEVGLRLARAWSAGNGVRITPSLYASYGRRLSGSTASSTHAFAGGVPFTVYSNESGKNSGKVEARVDFSFNEKLDAALFYRGDFASNAKTHSVGGALRVGF